MTAYTDLYGSQGKVYGLEMVVVAAAGSIYVGSDAVLVAAASVSDAAISSAGVASSTTGGQIVIARMIPSTADQGGSADSANTADHAALKAADV
jgi:hypothetical protein|tara:strand:+ start:640 stop:921 length:282 start_codon:yes stop_codon:yes gene_type:complete